jgi:hypothetical protein
VKVSTVGWWMTYLAALLVLLLACWSCSPRPEPVSEPPRTVPADQRVEELTRREQDHRLTLAQAQADAETARRALAQATTAESRAQAEAARLKAETIITRETLLAGEVRRLRNEQEAVAERQRQDLDEHRAKTEAVALLREQDALTARDRRTALIVAAIATALAGGGGLALWRLGVPLRYAALLPGTIAAAAAIGLGILAAGPWLAWVLQAAVGLALLLGLAKAATALDLMAWFGHRAAAADPQSPTTLANLRDEAQALTEKAGVRALVRKAVQSTRPLKP